MYSNIRNLHLEESKWRILISLSVHWTSLTWCWAFNMKKTQKDLWSFCLTCDLSIITTRKKAVFPIILSLPETPVHTLLCSILLPFVHSLLSWQIFQSYLIFFLHHAKYNERFITRLSCHMKQTRDSNWRFIFNCGWYLILHYIRTYINKENTLRAYDSSCVIVNHKMGSRLEVSS